MKNGKIDFETLMVASDLRDKLFRVCPLKLTYKFQIMDEDAEDYISEIKETLICFGALTPVLLDAKGCVIAGQGFVNAAIRIGLDDILAINFEELNASDRITCINSMRDYFDNVNMDEEDFLIETQHLLPFVLNERIACDIIADTENSAAA